MTAARKAVLAILGAVLGLLMAAAASSPTPERVTPATAPDAQPYPYVEEP